MPFPLSQILTNTLDSLKVKVTNHSDEITSTPVTGVKTITSVAAEVFAGASAKSNRRKLVIKNEDAVLRIRIGSSSVTQQNGFPIEPGAVVELQFDPSIYVPIYAISEGAQVSIAVFEY